MSSSADINGFIEDLCLLGGGREAPRTFRQFVLAADADKADAVLRNPDVFRKQYGSMDMLFRSRLNTDGREWQARRSLTQDDYNAAAKPRNRQRMAECFEAALDDGERRPSTSTKSLQDVVSLALMVATSKIFFDALDADHDTTDLAIGVGNLRKLVHAIELTSLSADSKPNLDVLRRGIENAHLDWRLYAAWEPGVRALVERFGQGYASDFDPTTELLANFLAGAESSAAVLSWAMLIIGGFPELQERLRTEASGGPERGGMDVFLAEVLRLFPPFPVVTRVAVQDFVSATFSARQGDSVLVSIVGVHLDPDHWVSPKRFDPERPEFVGKTYTRKAFIPFLHGPRVCGGASLARMELGEGLSALLRRFRFRRTSAITAFQYAAVLRPVLDGALSIERL